MRWRLVLGGFALMTLVGAVAAVALAGRYDLSGLAAGYATRALGRTVSIGALHVTPGRWLTIELRDARLDNAPGGSQPVMADLASLHVEVEALSLLHGPPVIRRLDVDNLRVLLEHTADGGANWRFGRQREPGSTQADSKPASRAGFPALLDAHASGELVFRTSSGNAIRIGMERLALQTTAADQPVRLTGAGAYNGTPIGIEAGFAPIATLRDAAIPYPTDLRFVSGATTLRFEGTMTEPLDLDGARGTLTLDAPTPDALYGIAGIASDIRPALRLTGRLEHAGPLWQLTAASGALAAAAITGGSLRLDEAARGKPDQIGVELAFDELDLNPLLGGKPRGATASANVSIAVDPAPDTLIDATLSAARLAYGDLRATGVQFTAAQTAGRIAVEELSMTVFGAEVQARGSIEALDADRNGSGRVAAEIDVTGLDVLALRRALGFGAVPLQGQMDGRLEVTATGATLNQATRSAHVSAVVAMRGGSIAREVIELASIDARALFRTARGTSPVSCVVAVVDMRAGIGTIAPLRIRARDGTIAGAGQFDLFRRQLDITFGSESRTTSSFALDIPIRVSGSFTNPTVRPASWSADGRAMIAAGDNLGRLLPSLQPFARRSPCVSGR